MDNSQCKIFKDPIYGYISVKKDYCRDFIDTPIFQRLRRIEQTSMRILFPSAHHDRFIHSLGVFYLGQMAFSNLRINSESFFPNISSDDWNSYKITFEIACLMHDCGHAPFSHTFEHEYFDGKNVEVVNEEWNAIFEKDISFENDFKNKETKPAPHEQISALLLLKSFGDKIKQNGGNPQLAARMIMGCKYNSISITDKQRFENKLISLLNGDGIDVDSLDYIQRDSWTSGVNNVQIDYQRLLSSIMIKPDKDGILKIGFKKNALSVLDNICIGRNFLYQWIYSHHIVQYEQYLLKNILKKINADSNNELFSNIFSIKAFSQSVIYNKNDYYLPSDADLLHIIKQNHTSNLMVAEYLSRNYTYKALWKTHVEYEQIIFKDVSSAERMAIVAKLENIEDDESILSTKGRLIKVTPKLKNINTNTFFIDIDGVSEDPSRFLTYSDKNLTYNIVFVPTDSLSKKGDIITKIRKLQK